ncbi:hypothetical protein RI367_000175 [Sorochytrium milnesiophthora]
MTLTPTTTAEVTSLYELLRQRHMQAPVYHRGYVWTRSDVRQFCVDLVHHAQQRQRYFIGTVTLQGQAGQAAVVVVEDGLQRLVTVCIVLSVVRAVLAMDDGGSASAPWAEVDALLQTVRLRLPERRGDRAAFEKYVLGGSAAGMQTLLAGGETMEMAMLDGASPAQERMVDAAQAAYAELVLKSKEEVLALARYLCHNVHAVVVTLQQQTEEEGGPVHCSLNTRGVPLTPVQSVRAAVYNHHGNTALQEWDACEGRLTNLGGSSSSSNTHFESLLEALMVVYQATQAAKSVQERVDAVQLHTTLDNSPQTYPEQTPLYAFASSTMPTLVAGWVAKYAPHYAYMVTAASQSTTRGQRRSTGRRPDETGTVGKCLRFMEMLDTRFRKYWAACVLLLLERFPTARNHYPTFQQLETLFTYHVLLVKRRSESEVCARTVRVLETLHSSQGGGDYTTGLLRDLLQLNRGEREQMARVINGDVYTSTRASLARHLLLRVNEQITQDGVVYSYGDVEIEHVLPQHPEAQSEWRRAWSDDERRVWQNRLGNLVLLYKEHNRQVSNKEYLVKRAAYMQDARGQTVPFAMTLQACQQTQWTASECSAMHARWVGELARVYGCEGEIAAMMAAVKTATIAATMATTTTKKRSRTAEVAEAMDGDATAEEEDGGGDGQDLMRQAASTSGSLRRRRQPQTLLFTLNMHAKILAIAALIAVAAAAPADSTNYGAPAYGAAPAAPAAPPADKYKAPCTEESAAPVAAPTSAPASYPSPAAPAYPAPSNTDAAAPSNKTPCPEEQQPYTTAPADTEAPQETAPATQPCPEEASATTAAPTYAATQDVSNNNTAPAYDSSVYQKSLDNAAPAKSFSVVAAAGALAVIALL